MGSIPESGRSPGEGNGTHSIYSIDGTAWQTTVDGITKSDMTEQLSMHAHKHYMCIHTHVLVHREVKMLEENKKKS